MRSIWFILSASSYHERQWLSGFQHQHNIVLAAPPHTDIANQRESIDIRITNCCDFGYDLSLEHRCRLQDHSRIEVHYGHFPQFVKLGNDRALHASHYASWVG